MDQFDKELVSQLRSGTERAYKYLYDHYYCALCKCAWHYVQDKDEAEDIVNEVISRLWERRGQLEVKVSLTAYLMCAVRNSCLNRLRRTDVLTTSEKLEKGCAVTDILDSSARIEEEQLAQLIHRVKNSLSDECRTVFCASRIDGKTYRQIAKELNISVNTVKYHITRALEEFRKALGPYLAIAFFILQSDFKHFL